MSLLDPDAWKVWGQEEKRVTEDEMVHSIFELEDMSLSKFQETVKDRKASHDAVHGVTKSQTCVMTEQENFKAHERHLKERGKRKTLYSSIPFNLWRKVYKWWPYTRYWVWCWAWDGANHVSPMGWVSQLFNTWANVCLKGYWEWVRKMCSLGDETWTVPERMD